MDIRYYKHLGHTFKERTGTILWYEDLLELGLEPRNVAASFYESDCNLLQSFCRENPEFHIVTRISDYLTVNKFVPGNHLFRLARGDQDPELELVYPPEIVDHLMGEIELIVKRMKPEVGF